MSALLARDMPLFDDPVVSFASVSARAAREHARRRKDLVLPGILERDTGVCKLK